MYVHRKDMIFFCIFETVFIYKTSKKHSTLHLNIKKDHLTSKNANNDAQPFASR